MEKNIFSLISTRILSISRNEAIFRLITQKNRVILRNIRVITRKKIPAALKAFVNEMKLECQYCANLGKQMHSRGIDFRQMNISCTVFYS